MQEQERSDEREEKERGIFFFVEFGEGKKSALDSETSSVT